MTAERPTESTTTLQTVAFIDTWLDSNATWVDSRVVDFALDVRTLLSTDTPLPAVDREPVGADA
jgi:hypothetical protein